MSSHKLGPLIFLLTCTISNMTVSARHFPSQPIPAPTIAGGLPEGNTTTTTTVYNASAQLVCWGCVTESLEFLFMHNWARAQHVELPLIWDLEVEKYARWWAGERKSDCRLQHSFGNGTFVLGENIFWGRGSGWSPSDAVRAWLDEGRFYAYGSNRCLGGHVCGHYTQVVWSSTRRLGCARVLCDNGDVFMTCNYDPPGNYVGEKPY